MSIKIRFKRYGTVDAKRSKRYTKNARVRYGHGVKFGRPTVFQKNNIYFCDFTTLRHLLFEFLSESNRPLVIGTVKSFNN